MKKKFIFSTMLVCLLVLVLSGCATNLSPNWENRWFVHEIEPGRHDYTILGPVTVERTWIKILWGLSERGGVNYIDVLNEAKKYYPNVDAVIDINISSEENRNIFYSSRKFTVTGFAVKYAAEQKNARR